MPPLISVFGWLLPLLMGRSRRFAASFNRRLQMGIPLDADWLSLMTMAGEAGTTANLKVPPSVFSKAELAAIRAPTLLLIAEREMLYRPQRAVARARSEAELACAQFDAERRAGSNVFSHLLMRALWIRACAGDAG
jgi:hypothetical protein